MCYASFSSRSTVTTVNKLGSTNAQIEILNDRGSLYVWSWFACFEALIVLFLFDKFADVVSFHFCDENIHSDLLINVFYW